MSASSSLILLVALCCVVGIHSTSYNAVLNPSTANSAQVTLHEDGVVCGNLNVGASGNVVWTTGEQSYYSTQCLINTDEVNFANQFGSNCSMYVADSDQVDASTGTDIWMASASIVNPSTSGVCAVTAFTALGNTTPVVPSSGCSACSPSTVSLNASLHIIKYFGDLQLTVNAYTSIMSDSPCWSQDLNTGDFVQYSGPGSCNTPVLRVQLAVPAAISCNITVTNGVSLDSVGHVLAAMVSHDPITNLLCVNDAVASIGNQAMVTRVGACLPCDI